MNDQLEAMQDQQLNELFAKHVCNYSMLASLIDGVTLCGVRGVPGTGAFHLPSFCTNATAVLPWLEKWHTTAEHIADRPLPWHVLCEDGDHCYVGRATSFGRAAVLASIRAKWAQTSPAED
jgi:hypothetical protein